MNARGDWRATLAALTPAFAERAARLDESDEFVADNYRELKASGLLAAGGAAFFRVNGLERLFRDAQGARYHPLQEGLQKTLTARHALGLEI